jgi:hypothetical protein
VPNWIDSGNVDISGSSLPDPSSNEGISHNTPLIFRIPRAPIALPADVSVQNTNPRGGFATRSAAFLLIGGSVESPAAVTVAISVPLSGGRHSLPHHRGGSGRDIGRARRMAARLEVVNDVDPIGDRASSAALVVASLLLKTRAPVAGGVRAVVAAEGTGWRRTPPCRARDR